MRHLRGAALQVLLLPSSMVGPASEGTLVSATCPTKAFSSAGLRAAFRAVDLPVITAPTEHDLLAAACTREEPVVLVERALVDGRAGQLDVAG